MILSGKKIKEEVENKKIIIDTTTCQVLIK